MISIDILGKRHRAEQVLGPIRLKIGKGETIALLGPSGVGKSTLLRIAAGLDRDFGGTVRCEGRIGIVFQEPALLKWRTASRNITLMTGVSAKRAQSLMDELGLAGKQDHFPGQMSLGQQRRLALARALASEPDILLLDEPFASLDDALIDEMTASVARVIRARAMSCLMVTHSVREAAKMADRTYRLHGQPAGLVAL